MLFKRLAARRRGSARDAPRVPIAMDFTGQDVAEAEEGEGETRVMIGEPSRAAAVSPPAPDRRRR